MLQEIGFYGQMKTIKYITTFKEIEWQIWRKLIMDKVERNWWWTSKICMACLDFVTLLIHKWNMKQVFDVCNYICCMMNAIHGFCTESLTKSTYRKVTSFTCCKPSCKIKHANTHCDVYAGQFCSSHHVCYFFHLNCEYSTTTTMMWKGLCGYLSGPRQKTVMTCAVPVHYVEILYTK